MVNPSLSKFFLNIVYSRISFFVSVGKSNSTKSHITLYSLNPVKHHDANILYGTSYFCRLLKVVSKVLRLFHFRQFDNQLCISQREVGRVTEIQSLFNHRLIVVFTFWPFNSTTLPNLSTLMGIQVSLIISPDQALWDLLLDPSSIVGMRGEAI